MGVQEFGDCGPDVSLDLFLRSVGVDYFVVVGVLGGLGEVIFSYLFVVGHGALFDSVFGAADSGHAFFHGHVEDEGEIRPAVLDGDACDGFDFFGGDVVSALLVGEGAGDEAVGEDGLAFF
jgi:hypothetical protein